MNVIKLLNELGLELSSEQEFQIKQSIGRDFVPRSDFKAKVSLVKSLKAKIADLEQRDFAAVESACNSYKVRCEALERELSDSVKKNKFFAALGNCRDKEYMLYKLGGLDQIRIDETGELKDIENAVQKLKDENPMFFSDSMPSIEVNICAAGMSSKE